MPLSDPRLKQFYIFYVLWNNSNAIKIVPKQRKARNIHNLLYKHLTIIVEKKEPGSPVILKIEGGKETFIKCQAIETHNYI